LLKKRLDEKRIRVPVRELRIYERDSRWEIENNDGINETNSSKSRKLRRFIVEFYRQDRFSWNIAFKHIGTFILPGATRSTVIKSLLKRNNVRISSDSFINAFRRIVVLIDGTTRGTAKEDRETKPKN